MRLFNSSSIQVHSILQLLLTVAASILTLRIGVGLAAWRAANRLEKPTYTVVKRLPFTGHARGEVEIRKYDPYLIAETTVDESSFRKAGTLGFGKCAGFIFGKNKPIGGRSEPENMAMTAPVRTQGVAGEKMAMTSPVRSEGSNKGKTKISFVIGSKYTLQSVPRPIDKSVKVKRVDGHYLAARTFSGPPPSDERVIEERHRLVQVCDREGIRVKGGKDETFVYGYHDPVVTPNRLRKNEVCIMIDGSSLN